MKNILYILLVIITSCGQKSNLNQQSTNTNSIEAKVKDSGQTFDSTITSEEFTELHALQGNIKIKSFPPKRFKQFDFSLIENKISDTLKLELLRKIVFTEYLLATKFESNESYYFENYHILDFNADKKLDIIYDGRNPMGIETNNVVFFLNKGDSLIPVIKINGDFTKIEIKDNQLQTFQLIKSPCCANFIYRIEDYKFNDFGDCFQPQNGNHENYKYSYGQVNDPSFCVSIVSQYAYVLKTEFPSRIKTIKTSSVSKKAFLTPKPLEPSNIDFEEDGVAFSYTDNKAISELPIGIDCQIISEKEDGNGNRYCFIVFSNIEKNNNYMSSIEFEQYGWINKKYLN